MSFDDEDINNKIEGIDNNLKEIDNHEISKINNISEEDNKKT